VLIHLPISHSREFGDGQIEMLILLEGLAHSSASTHDLLIDVGKLAINKVSDIALQLSDGGFFLTLVVFFLLTASTAS
jgi:hypothetical protein